MTIRLKPKLKEMYSNVAGSNPVVSPVVLCAAVELPIFAVLVPANAKKRNMKVPTNSPMNATMSAASQLCPLHIHFGKRTILGITVHESNP